jgi:hypothetical protein
MDADSGVVGGGTFDPFDGAECTKTLHTPSAAPPVNLLLTAGTTARIVADRLHDTTGQ